MYLGEIAWKIWYTFFFFCYCQFLSPFIVINVLMGNGKVETSHLYSSSLLNLIQFWGIVLVFLEAKKIY